MDTLEKAIKFLMGSQRPDGSWGNGDPFVCARVMLALKDDAPEGMLLKGLEYLEGRQETDGHFKPVGGMYSDATSTAYALIVLNKFDYGKASLPVSRGIVWLVESQNEDGSWGRNKEKKAYTTTFCLRALHAFYLSGINRFARGLEFSLGYLRGLDFSREPVSHVYAPILNLYRMSYLDDGLRDKFFEFALDAAEPALEGGSVADVAYLLGTLKALEETDVSAALEEWLAAAQHDDGSFGKDLASPGDPNWTALVALAIKGML
ncbi:prenyltransferase/squalene oxidase repeat-containing protein [Methanocella conradii]|uniref:prenyltransferase/squalene oxidase repeat-containing protein n=1 Tax=Methanocella conradii TaxID=1175444 RepID=UPI00157D5E89|nr:prenyltransferase/squalene oxidase repeat-containing protein [Methanocella conradii]